MRIAVAGHAVEEHGDGDQGDRVDADRREGKGIARRMDALTADNGRQSRRAARRMQAAKERT